GPHDRLSFEEAETVHCSHPPTAAGARPDPGAHPNRSSRSRRPRPAVASRPMGAVLAIDAGTTGVRAMVLGSDPLVLTRGYREFPQSFPQPGWVEHDPEDWWSALLAATDEALAAAGRSATDIDAIGITNQRETTVLWDRATLKAVHPA